MTIIKISVIEKDNINAGESLFENDVITKNTMENILCPFQPFSFEFILTYLHFLFIKSMFHTHVHNGIPLLHLIWSVV